MTSLVQILVVIAALMAVASGIWVAAALVRTLIKKETKPHPDARTEPRP